MKSDKHYIDVKVEKSGKKRIILLQIKEIPGISEPISAYVRSEFKDSYLVYMKAAGGGERGVAVFSFEVMTDDTRIEKQIEISLLKKLDYLVENIDFARKVIAASDLPKRLDLFRKVLDELKPLPYDPKKMQKEAENFFLHRTPEYLYDREAENLAYEIKLNIKIGAEGLPKSSIPFIEAYNNRGCRELNSVLHIATRDLDAGFFLDQISKFRPCTINYVKQFFFRKHPDTTLIIHIEFQNEDGEQLRKEELEELKYHIITNIQKFYLVDYSRFDVYLRTYYPQFAREVQCSGMPQAIFLPITFSPKTFSLYALFPENSENQIMSLLNDKNIKPYLMSISWEICPQNTIAIKLYLLTPNEVISEDLDEILEKEHKIHVFDRGSRVIATSLLKDLHKSFPTLIAFPSTGFLVTLAMQGHDQLQTFMNKLKEFIGKKKMTEKFRVKKYEISFIRIPASQAFQNICAREAEQFHFCFQVEEEWYINIRVKEL
ncbi:hypothetical protein JXI42_11210 [bacterium]|nr:hypothetical protein [bacterium]